MEELVNYMLAWSAAGKYCQREHISFSQLREKLSHVLYGHVQADDHVTKTENIASDRDIIGFESAMKSELVCVYDSFVWYSIKP